MRKAVFFVSTFFAVSGSCVFAQAPAGQTASSAAASNPSKARVIGVLTSVDGGKLVLKTDAGAEVAVVLGPSARVLRVPPGEKDLKNATKIEPSDLAAGDRVLAIGPMSEDQKSLTASSVAVMTKTDLAKKQAGDQAAWQQRGVSGVVDAVNSEAKEVTIKQRGREGMKTVVIALGPTASVRRYAPESVRFMDAKPSQFTEIKAGDQIRVLGDKNEDGTKITADEAVFGTFQNIAGTIVSVDPTGSEIKLMNLTTKKPVIVKVNPDSSIHRLPASAAQMIAARNSGTIGGPGGAGAPNGAGGGPGGWQRPGGAPGGERASGPPPAGSGQPGVPGRPGGMGAGPGGGMGGGRNFDIAQMLERLPSLPLTELKPGDALIVSGTVGADPAKTTAITLLAGVEPILTAAPAGGARLQQMMGSWNLDAGGGGFGGQ